MTKELKIEKLKECNKVCKNTLMDTLDIVYTDIGDNFVVAEMPVTPKVHQPDGVLHGGAMVALAESVGSLAAYMFVDYKKFSIRGIEISANHVRGIRNGKVIARAEALHFGRTTQLWQIMIRNESEELISAVKLTTIALPRK